MEICPLQPQSTESLSPTTTVEEDLYTQSRRKIDLIWEVTQAIIAIGVVAANLAGAFKLEVTNQLLANAFFLIVGFYFGRTNHARKGGLPI